MKFVSNIGVALRRTKRIHIAPDVRLVSGICLMIIISAFTLHNAPVIGMYVNALVAIILVSLSLLYAPAKKIGIISAVMLVSLMVPMSLQHTSQFAKTSYLYGVLLLLSLVYRFLFAQDQTPPSKSEQNSRTWKNYITNVPQGIVLGQLLGGLAFLLLPHIRPFSSVSTGLLLAAAVAFAVVEVVFFQSLLQANASETISPALAIGLTTVVYVSLSSTVSIGAFVVNVIAGCSFAVAYYLKRDILSIMLANSIMKVVYIALIMTAAS